jgi:cell migration-inducing and hyaluronan-binding protein
VLIHDGVNDSIATDTRACQIKKDWNAAICKGDVGRLNVGGPGGGFGGPRGGGPGAGGSPGATPARGGAPGAGPGAGAAPGRGAGPGAAPAGGPGFTGPAPAARAGGPGGAPAQPPVILSRDGKDYQLTGTNVRAGTEIKVKTERPSVNLSLSELNAGSWVIFELPGFNTAAAGTAVDSLDALRKASDTSYYKARDALWVKVVSTATGGRDGGASLQVSR